jgi:hypothetical protein
MDEKEWEKRPPAKMTLELLKDKEKEICELREKNQKFELNIQGMGDKLDNISEKLVEHVKQQKDDFSEMKKTLTDFIESADRKYADSEQFRFWRNLLITGLVLSIAVGIIGILLDKYLGK